ncbi:YadA-like family protein [Mesorhizobium sp. ES1-1]|uniref:YadA-like family protein n=1 Tax=Mesorhizobium sp. ES1-1 TaxID=2876629 RepID=UPI001CCB1D6C|nr:YadA-like family protein [Mesorhizobium sp. ES1-1]MBZ9679003.1 YadA-like family protein [Mesorhizobium sp. ES1-1]
MGLAISTFASETAFAVTCGAGNETADENDSLACGDGTVAYGDQSVAVGVFAATGSEKTNSNFDTAVGYATSAFGESLAVGALAKAGFDSQIDPSRYHTAIGTGAEAGQGANGLEYSTAVGYLAKANASNAIAMGASAEANFTGSVAIGAAVKTTRDNQVAIGNGQNTYTLAGVASQASKDAQGETTYLMTTDENGNLAASTFDVATLEGLPAKVTQNTTAISNLTTTVSSHTTELADHETRITNNTSAIVDLDTRVTTNTNNITQLDGRVGALESGFQDLGGQISENRTEARAGTALALATAGLRYDDRPGKLSLAGGFGNFKGQSGLALGLGYNPSLDFRLNGAISATTDRGDVGVSLGASWTLN